MFLSPQSGVSISPVRGLFCAFGCLDKGLITAQEVKEVEGRGEGGRLDPLGVVSLRRLE